MQKCWMGPTYLHGALSGGRARCWDSHPTSATRDSSRWHQPRFIESNPARRRCERVYHAGSQEAGCWALNPVSNDLQSVFPPPQGVGWLRLAPWRDTAHTGLPGRVHRGAGCWLPRVRGCGCLSPVGCSRLVLAPAQDDQKPHWCERPLRLKVVSPEI